MLNVNNVCVANCRIVSCLFSACVSSQLMCQTIWLITIAKTVVQNESKYNTYYTFKVRVAKAKANGFVVC